MGKVVVWGLLALAVAGGVFVLARGRPVRVDVATIERGTIRSFVEDEGRTRVRDRFVVSASVSGRLQRVMLQEGSTVSEGDLVAEIDPLPLQSRVAEAEAAVRALKRRIEGVATKKPKPEELERARIVERKAGEAVEIARRSLEEHKALAENARNEEARLRKLARAEAIPDAEYDVARAADIQARQRVLAQEVRLKVVELEVSIATLGRKVLESRLHDFDWEEREYGEQIAGVEAKLASMRDDVRRAKIFAPASGRVLAVHRESEQVVTAGTPILDIGDLRRMDVEVDFLSEDVAHMKKDMRAEVFGRALGAKTVSGRIARIYPSAFKKISSLGVEQQRVNVVIELGEPLPLGDQYRVEVRVILESQADAVLVPEGALFRSEGKWHAFVVRDDQANLQAVETGLRDGTRREVLSGLQAGDRVVLHPGEALQDEDAVETLGR